MILVAGATGHLGGAISRRLLAKGQSVRALVRDSSAYQELQKSGAEIAFGDLKDSQSLVRACQGVDQVITTANAVLRGGDDTIESVDLVGTGNLIDAAKSANVKQFVYVSAYSFDSDSRLPLARAKGVNEMRLRQSGLNFTVLKPVMFMESWIGFVIGAQLQQGPSVTVVGDDQTLYGFVAIDNVAELAVGVLDHPAAQNTAIDLNGPGLFSYRDIVGMVAQTTGQSIQIRSVSAGEPVPGMPSVVNELWASFSRMGGVNLDTTDVAKTFEINLISVPDFIKRTFGRA